MKQEEIIEHYDSHDDFYEIWSGSRQGGYHFGIVEKPLDIFSNSKMIRNAGCSVIEDLKLDFSGELRVLDAGCGAGHISRLLAGNFKNDKQHVYGVTISKKQIEIGERLNEKMKLENKVSLSLNNFEKLPFQDDFFDAVYFVEAICHGEGYSKKKALSEAWRVLKTGGRVVIHDGFINKEKVNKRIISWINKRLCKAFAVAKWSDKKLFNKQLKELGFSGIYFESLFWKIAPSVVHIWVTKLPLSFVLFLLGRVSFNDLKYIFTVARFAPLVGLHPGFQYAKIVATKR